MTFLHQRHRRDNLAGRARSTLQAIEMHECGLHWMQFTVGCKAFDGGDCLVLALNGERQARDDPAAVDVDGTGSAGAAVAAFLRSGQG
jgi:hypothetical protein